MEARCERSNLIRNDATTLINDIKSRMNAEAPSFGKLIFLKKSLMEKYELLKKLDSELKSLSNGMI